MTIHWGSFVVGVVVTFGVSFLVFLWLLGHAVDADPRWDEEVDRS